MRFASASIGSLITLFIGLIASIALTRLLGLEGRGAFALATRSVGILGAIAQWGIPELMMGFLRSGKHSAGVILGTGLAMVIVTTLVLGAVCVVAAPQLQTSVLRGVPSDVLILVITSTVFTVSYTILRRVIQLRGQIVTYNVLDLAKSATFLLLIALVVLVFHTQLYGAILAFLLSEAALAVFCGAYVWWKLERAWTISYALGAQLARSGLLIQTGIIGMFLAGQAGVFIVNVYGSLADVGSYATALGLATYVTYISVSIRTVLHSRMMTAESQGEAVAGLTVSITRHTLVWLVASAVALAVLGRPIIVTLYGPEFEPAYPSLVLFLPGMVCLGLQQILASYFNARSEFRLPTLGALIASGVGVFLQLWLTPIFGATGAASALSIGYASALAMYVVMFSRRSGVPVRALLPRPADAAFYGALARQIRWARR